MAKSFHEFSPRTQIAIFALLSLTTVGAAWQVLIGPARAELATRHFNLLETLGEYVIGLLLNEFGAPWVKISIAKMGIMKGVRRVGVQIERSR